MTYAKPEVTVLGDATRVIQAANKFDTTIVDGGLVEHPASYEPEE
jgi:hypothetical protein